MSGYWAWGVNHEQFRMNAKYDKIEPIKQDKRDGIIRDLSEKTGLIVHAFEITKIAI